MVKFCGKCCVGIGEPWIISSLSVFFEMFSIPTFSPFHMFPFVFVCLFF